MYSPAAHVAVRLASWFNLLSLELLGRKMKSRIVLLVLFLSNLNFVSFARAKPADEPNAPSKKNRIIPDIGIECVYVKAGTFRIGSAESGPNDEKPVHQINISRSFWMGTCEITQAQWRALMGALSHALPLSESRRGYAGRQVLQLRISCGFGLPGERFRIMTAT